MELPVKTTKVVTPMIYAYTTPGITYHDGWIKIGYTEQDVEKRIKQQADTADIIWKREWMGTAFFEDGSYIRFTDKQFHAFLRKHGVPQKRFQTGTRYHEWFNISPAKSKSCFHIFKENHGILEKLTDVSDYTLRDEQNAAVEKTIAYMNSHKNGEFLWNAKPRFGKTLTTYDFCKRIGAKNILIVTNRPAIANSWFKDYSDFMGIQSGYRFVSEVDALRDRENVFSREEFLYMQKSSPEIRCIEFVSLQDMKGSVHFGGNFNKLEEVKNMEWDVLVIDEAHEGVDTYKTDVAFEQINRKFTLHLSGTPFKAIADDKFKDDAIFYWTYVDEQEMKKSWDSEKDGENPYAVLPQLNMFTYKMSDIVKEELEQGMNLGDENIEFAFDLNEFFSVDGNGNFIYDSSVNTFLDALTLQKKFPFSTQKLRNELKHTLWLLNRVDSATALAKKLKEHPIFKDYEIVLAAGTGKIDDDDEKKKSFDKVRKAIEKSGKNTITLSVGQLTTGVTIPEWTAVLMLSNIKSPSLYMQAAFRSQNPYLFWDGSHYQRKENAYVFDFDPARTLSIFENIANDLYSDTAGGKGDTSSHKENVKELLNFFPVIGEDEDGEMIELDAEKVLTIPRKIRSQEVVRRGFMSDFLFQNVSRVFSAPKEVLEIIKNIDPVEEPKQDINTLNRDFSEEHPVNEEGNISLDEKIIIGLSQNIFGEKIYESKREIQETLDALNNDDDSRDPIKQLKNFLQNDVNQDLITTAKEKYGNSLKRSVEKQLTKKLNHDSDKLVDKSLSLHKINKNEIELLRSEEKKNRYDTGKSLKQIDKEYDELIAKKELEFKNNLNSAITSYIESAKNEIVKTVEISNKEAEKKEVEDGVKDHLRGFSRTIPSFLMAYGDNTVTLSKFEVNIPDDVFVEVTSITKEQFKFLRDGGDYIDEETGEQKHFEGGLFDPVVFDDAVKEFMALKRKLKDYFDENNKEDIFDYIPPQKTNQIFTPKLIVKKMVDMLEEENPGCFDDPSKTFIDLYMKSGLYITEIVKRLYRSDKMKKAFPNDKLRLKHIFEKQVYGLAPTEIIYRIANSYILGFDENMDLQHNHLILLDSVPLVKNGTLQEELDKRFKNN